MSVRDSFIAQREAKLAEAKAIVETAEAEARDISDDELTTVKEAREAADALAARIEEMDALDAAQSRAFAATQTASVQVVSEPATYREAGDHSWFRDLYLSTRGDRDATERLHRNNAEARALSTTDTSGGDFVFPAYLGNEWIKFARAGRVSIDQLNKATLPAGTDSINVPAITTGTVSATQSSQNSGFNESDAVTATRTAAVHTIGGIQKLSVQLIEQGSVNLDQIIMADLVADTARALDVWGLTSNASGKYGLLNTQSAVGVTYTDASPTVAEFVAQVGNAIQQIHTNRYAAPTRILMHPRRWQWISTAVDGNSRLLIVPAAQGPFNATGTTEGVVAEGYAGTLLGLPVFIDANIPTNLGSGTDEDRVIVLKADDVHFFESAPKAEVFRETLANQGTVLFRAYQYAAMVARYGKSVAVISGTGLVNPYA